MVPEVVIINLDTSRVCITNHWILAGYALQITGY